MAATGTVSIIAELLGLGKMQQFVDKFSLTVAPTKAHYNYRQQATADTAEALDLGGVTSVGLIVFKVVTNDAILDTTYVSSFVSELIVAEGEIAVFKPTGTVWIKNEDGAEKVTYEYLVLGT